MPIWPIIGGSAVGAAMWAGLICGGYKLLSIPGVSEGISLGARVMGIG